MAETKKSFVLYNDLIHTIKLLEDELAGKVFKHILSYVNNEKLQDDNIVVNIAFEPIKQQLIRDRDKYKDVIDKKSNSGQLGNLKKYQKDLYDKFVLKELSLTDAVNIAKSRTASHRVANVAVNENDNVNENVNEKDIKEENKMILDEFAKILGKTKKEASDIRDFVKAHKFWSTVCFDFEAIIRNKVKILDQYIPPKPKGYYGWNARTKQWIKYIPNGSVDMANPIHNPKLR